MSILYYDSPIGLLKLESRNEKLIRLLPAGQGDSSDLDDLKLLEMVSWLDAYFRGIPAPAPMEAAPEGTDFEKSVWKKTAEIPFGKTCSYGEISRQICGSDRLARAVGNALGKNPVLLVIPCHRVIRKDGSFGGFAGGKEMKAALLKHEKRPESEK